MSASEAVVAAVENEVTAPLGELGLDVEAVELTPAGRRRVLRIAVDRDGGVNLDDVAEATKAIDRVLEQSDALGEHPYTLEVTSRGVDRPLTLPRHWRRNRTRLVEVLLADGEAVTGRITDAGEEQVTLDVEGATRTLDYARIDRALVQIEFKPKSED